jgi:branched-chain amino acid transport system permease protein
VSIGSVGARDRSSGTVLMTIFLSSVGFGLVTASVLAIASVGFTLQFAVTDVLNLAYGAVMIAGAFFAYLLNSHGVNIWIAAIGLLIVIFLWLRPQGILPERKRLIRTALPGAAAAAPAVPFPAKPPPGEAAVPGGPVVGAAVLPVVPVQPAGPTLSANTGSAGTLSANTVSADTVTGDGAGGGQRAAGDREVVLEAIDVAREFGGLQAVAGVSLAVRRGTLAGLIGPNGAVKSTLLAMLAGTLPVSDGQIRYQGADVTHLPAYRRARLGLIRTFQLASEFKRLTVMENLLTALSPDVP